MDGPGALRRRGTKPIALVLRTLLAMSLLCLPGCSGCRDDAADKPGAKALKKEKPKPDFSRLKLRVLPNDGRLTTRTIKPGHWTAARLRARANNFDFVGRAAAESFDMRGQPLEVERTPFLLSFTRPARLPKGSIRYMEFDFCVPVGRDKSRLDCQLRTRVGDQEIKRESEFMNHMPAQQYYFFVLAKNPDRYRYLHGLASVHATSNDIVTQSEDIHYRVLRPPIVTQEVPLPAEALAWTSIAYVLWDGIDPGALRADQQQAMLDWLQWGGQLIISGPDTLEPLQNSFLAPWLPARGQGSVKLSKEDLAELSRTWTLRARSGPAMPLPVDTPWRAARLLMHASAVSVPGADHLVVERQVGRGRIVVTAFALTRDELSRWPSFDSFFNAALLRRSPRLFSGNDSGFETARWVDAAPKETGTDPGRNTHLRFFSRDARESGQLVTSEGPLTVLDSAAVDKEGAYVGAQLRIIAGEGAGQSRQIQRYGTGRVARHDAWGVLPNATSTYRIDLASESGVAGWNDFGNVASAARDALRDAAGIAVPQRSFVFKVLAAYLLVVVPVNYLVFWSLGRVELAWVAAPVIAIVCAVIVVWRAQLDIGFARSLTEIDMVELQAGYPRAHVSRFTTLYTSLSTRYGLHFDDPSALVQPFARGVSFEEAGRQSRSNVEFRRDPHVQLVDFSVASNSSDMVRSESMYDVGGGVEMVNQGGGVQIRNGTQFALSAAVVIRRSAGGDHAPVESAAVAHLGAGQSAPLTFAISRAPLAPPMWETIPSASTKKTAGVLTVRRLLNLAVASGELAEGDVRLVALIDGEVPGMRVEPVASQVRRAGLLVANLAFAATVARADANLPLEKPSLDMPSDDDKEEEDIDDDEQEEAKQRSKAAAVQPLTKSAAGRS